MAADSPAPGAAARPDLDAIKARCDAATPGPWRRVPTTTRVTASDIGHPEEIVATFLADRIENAEFIAHARTDLPLAVETIQRLTAALTEAWKILDDPDTLDALSGGVVNGEKLSPEGVVGYAIDAIADLRVIVRDVLVAIHGQDGTDE